MPSRVAIARAIAITADAVQIGLFPLFSGGWISPANIALDTVVCVVLTSLLGWHIAFLPSFLAEGVPFLDLAPTWTLAVLIKTRKAKASTTPANPQAPPKPTASEKGQVIDVESKTVSSVNAPPVIAPPGVTTGTEPTTIKSVTST